MINFCYNLNYNKPAHLRAITQNMTTSNTNDTISIYIHRAHSGCNDPDLFRDTFNRVLGADCVRSVDLVKKTDNNGVNFIRAFIHFKFWPNGETADRMYNDLITDKRVDITYNRDSRWFWKFCRSKLPSRGDTNNAPRRKKNNKPRYGGGDNNTNKPPTHDTLMCDVPTTPVVLKRTVTTGYRETSNRKVSNKPSWMMLECGGHSNCRANSDIDETNSLMSDDGEFDDGEFDGCDSGDAPNSV